MRDLPILILFIITLLFIPLSTQDEPDTSSSASSTIEERDRVARAVNEFGYKLMLEMMKENKNQNIVISPSGIAGLLAMTLLGSVGSSYDELAKALGFSQDILENRKNHEQFGDLLQKLNLNAEITPAVDIDVTTTETSANQTQTLVTPDNTTESLRDVPTRTLYADAIVVDAKTRIRNIYREYLNKVYRGDAITAHFEDEVASQQLINDWVANHTDGRIEEFLTEPLPTATKVVLLSALYFSGQWARPFVQEYTRNMTFRGPSGEVIAAKLMLNLGEFDYIFKSHHDVHMIALPYNDSTTTMYVMKPHRKKTTLLELMQHLDFTLIDQLIQNMTKEDCALRFPKMDLKTKIDLQSSLKAIGIKSLFTPGDANFALMVDAGHAENNDSDILARIYENSEETKKLKDAVSSLPNPGVYVDSVLHDVKMTIDEYGTVAVAATSGFLSRTARLFYADSPFYMFIRNNKTKLITFSAVIYDPTAT